MDPNQKFYRSFQDSVAAIQNRIAQLDSVSAVAEQRQEAIDRLLVEITKLQNDVADAADSTPSYDRRQYADTIRTLHEKANEAVARVTPKTRFQFRGLAARTAGVTVTSSDKDARLNPQGSLRKDDSASAAVTHDDLGSGTHAARDYYSKDLAEPKASHVGRPSSSTAKTISISKQKDLHIILPPSAAQATASGSLTALHKCIVDMSGATAQGNSFAGLAINDVTKGLIITGRVDGPVHITGVVNSILVVLARQVRIHECKDVDVYLHCSSHPIIEDCTAMRFAPLPGCLSAEPEAAAENQWDQVDDFKWLKAGPSPNWSILPEAQRLSHDAWSKVLQSPEDENVEETLRQIGVS